MASTRVALAVHVHGVIPNGVKLTIITHALDRLHHLVVNPWSIVVSFESGYQVGLGYNHTADNGVFVRVELAATEYDDVSATNVNDSEKTVTVSEMYGATASIKIGKSF